MFGCFHVNFIGPYTSNSILLINLYYRISTEERKSFQGNLQGVGDGIAISDNG